MQMLYHWSTEAVNSDMDSTVKYLCEDAYLSGQDCIFITPKSGGMMPRPKYMTCHGARGFEGIETISLIISRVKNLFNSLLLLNTNNNQSESKTTRFEKKNS